MEIYIILSIGMFQLCQLVSKVGDAKGSLFSKWIMPHALPFIYKCILSLLPLYLLMVRIQSHYAILAEFCPDFAAEGENSLGEKRLAKNLGMTSKRTYNCPNWSPWVNLNILNNREKCSS